MHSYIAQILLKLIEINLQFTNCISFFVIARCDNKSRPLIKPYKFSNKRLRDLGLEFTPIKESLYNMILSLQEKGDLPTTVVPRASL